MCQPIKYVLWDLDGTILDTETISTQAIQMILDPYGKDFEWKVKERILGLKGEDWAKIVIEHYDLPNELHWTDLIQQWEKYLTTLYDQVNALPGVQSLVEGFSKSQVIVSQAIATSSNSTAVSHKRRKHKSLFSHFSCIVSGDDPELKRGKPFPDIFLLTARRMGIIKPQDYEQCLVIEDSLPGVIAGKSAGMKVVAVPDRRLDKKAFLEVADEVLDSLENFDYVKWGLEKPELFK